MLIAIIKAVSITISIIHSTMTSENTRATLNFFTISFGPSSLFLCSSINDIFHLHGSSRWTFVYSLNLVFWCFNIDQLLPTIAILSSAWLFGSQWKRPTNCTRRKAGEQEKKAINFPCKSSFVPMKWRIIEMHRIADKWTFLSRCSFDSFSLFFPTQKNASRSCFCRVPMFILILCASATLHSPHHCECFENEIELLWEHELWLSSSCHCCCRRLAVVWRRLLFISAIAYKLLLPGWLAVDAVFKFFAALLLTFIRFYVSSLRLCCWAGSFSPFSPSHITPTDDKFSVSRNEKKTLFPFTHTRYDLWVENLSATAAVSRELVVVACEKPWKNFKFSFPFLLLFSVL